MPDPLSPAPPRLQPEYVRPAPIPVDIPIVPPEVFELSVRQRVGLWLGRKAVKVFGGVAMLEKFIPVNRKTTFLGILSALGLVSTAAVAALDGNPATDPNWPMVISAILGIAGIGHAAKDKDVTGAGDQARRVLPKGTKEG